MIRHVVMFALSSTDETQRATDVAQIQERLAGLLGVIPGLQAITLQPDLGLIEDHWDVVLISDHDDNAALGGYQAHPEHVAAGAFIRSVTRGRATVDYEV